MNIQNIDRRDYPIVEQIDEDFEIRGIEIPHVFNNLVRNEGCDKGMILKVLNVRHFVQFCKSMNFHHGYKVGVEVVKAVHKDYKKGEVFDIFVPGHMAHMDLTSYLGTKYNFN